MSKIGLQLYSIKEIAQKDFFGAIKLTADSGYDGIEFAGYFDTPASELKNVLSYNGIIACGCHTGINQLEIDFDAMVEYNLEIGNKNIVIPFLPEEMRNSRDAWLATAEKMNKLNEMLKKHGIRLGYHNHAFEFEKFDGIYGYDILAANTSSEILLEIDTFWVEYPGEDAVEYVKKYQDRLDLLHIKDMDGNKVSTEIGNGTLDFPAIIKAAEKTEWFIVEQEHFSIPQPEAIKISCDYLKGVVK